MLILLLNYVIDVNLITKFHLLSCKSLKVVYESK